MANCGISFNSIDLSSVSPHFQLIDVQVGSPDVSVQAHDLGGTNGQAFGSRKYGARQISILFDIQNSNERHRAEALTQLRYLLNTKAPGKFRSLAHGNRYLNVVCVTFPDASALEWVEDLSIELLALDPFWYSDDEALAIPLATGDTPFYVDCTEEICPVITQTLTSAVTDPTWTASNGQYIMLQGSVGPGELVIDCTRQRESITLDGADILIQMALDSEFFRFAPRSPFTEDAPHVITTVNGAGGHMTAQYRWL